jgi:HNH endonuclease
MDDLVIDGIETRAIPDWPGYRAGVDGSIWSCLVTGKTGAYSNKWRQRKQHNTKNGRKRLMIRTTDGAKKNMSAHILVCLAFHGPRPPGTECCHNNGNSLDNRPDNLRWDTREANIADTVKHGVHKGTKNPNSTLDESVVGDVRLRISRGETQKSIAKSLGVSQMAISRINTRKHWGHVS